MSDDDFQAQVLGHLLAFGQRFDAIDQRFDAMDRRFDAIDRRFDALDARLDAMDGRFDAINHRLDEQDATMDVLIGKVDRVGTLSRNASEASEHALNGVIALNRRVSALERGRRPEGDAA